MKKVALFEPNYDKVIVLPDEAESVTKSGIIIPDNAKERPKAGTIIAAGSGKKTEPMLFKMGERVMYSKYSGTEIDLDVKDLETGKTEEKNCLIMAQLDIMGKLL